jgi:hypothetical protein
MQRTWPASCARRVPSSASCTCTDPDARAATTNSPTTATPVQYSLCKVGKRAKQSRLGRARCTYSRIENTHFVFIVVIFHTHALPASSTDTAVLPAHAMHATGQLWADTVWQNETPLPVQFKTAMVPADVPTRMLPVSAAATAQFARVELRNSAPAAALDSLPSAVEAALPGTTCTPALFCSAELPSASRVWVNNSSFPLASQTCEEGEHAGCSSNFCCHLT